MLGLILRRLGAGVKYGLGTIAMLVSGLFIGGAASATGAPSFIHIVIGITAFTVWVVFVFNPMMRTARRHASEERQIMMEDSIRLGMADYNRQQAALRKVQDEWS